MPILGSLFDLQVHEDIGKQNIFNLFNEVASSAIVNTTQIILFKNSGRAHVLAICPAVHTGQASLVANW